MACPHKKARPLNEVIKNVYIAQDMLEVDTLIHTAQESEWRQEETDDSHSQHSDMQHQQCNIEVMNWWEQNGVGQIEHDLQLAGRVRESGIPNVYGTQIPLKSLWNFQLLESLARSTSDREVVQFLRFGWPLNRELDAPLTITLTNHTGATAFATEVDAYFQKELHSNALVGPLCTLPAMEHMAVSPLTTRPKKSSSKRRVISDLSWPAGALVNDGIPKSEYLGQVFKIKYPSVDLLCRRAVELSVGKPQGKIQGYKVDLHCAFRQIPMCP